MSDQNQNQNPNQNAAPVVFNLVQAQPAPTGPKRFDLTEIARVDKNDLTAIVTARHEKGVRDEIRSVSKALEEATARANKIKRDIQTALEAFVLSYPSSALPSLQASLKSVGFESEITVSGEFSPRTATASWARKHDSGSLTSDPRTSIHIRSSLVTDHGSSFILHINAPLPPDLSNLFLAESKTDAEVSSLDRDLMNARQRLSNIASVERAARAAIAENALRSSGPEGEALLDSLSSVNPMPLLPETRPAYRTDGN